MGEGALFFYYLFWDVRVLVAFRRKEISGGYLARFFGSSGDLELSRIFTIWKLQMLGPWRDSGTGRRNEFPESRN